MIWLLIFILPLAVVLGFYIRDLNLDIYTNEDNGTLIFNEKVFKSGYKTNQTYYRNGERKFEVEKLIGKTNNSKFFGFKESVYKIKGKSSDKVVFLKGLMIEGIYER